MQLLARFLAAHVDWQRSLQVQQDVQCLRLLKQAFWQAAKQISASKADLD